MPLQACGRPAHQQAVQGRRLLRTRPPLSICEALFSSVNVLAFLPPAAHCRRDYVAGMCRVAPVRVTLCCRVLYKTSLPVTPTERGEDWEPRAHNQHMHASNTTYGSKCG